ncbi:M14 family zinc carboxypeptidase [Pinirhizobacter soli]|uniref:M14 family zinc carboxypeptidase n=1 Tax=Pinirhizobacter soli TaxID=2786953 RepID=UPI002029DA6F|nr:M14 family zinc carboxypeptidase [Pinirhizobacter soli]
MKTPLRFAMTRLLFPALALTGAAAWANNAPTNPGGINFSTDFESGSIGMIRPLDTAGLAFELALRNDNDDASLPDSFRTWWYVHAANIPTSATTRLEFTRLGFSDDFRPVYSYDGVHWQYFSDAEAGIAPGCVPEKPDTCRMVVNKRFEQPTAYIARTFPYTTKDLSNFLDGLHSPNVTRRLLTQSPTFGKPIEEITITDPVDRLDPSRRTVVVHARTHAAETGGSYVVEGLVRAPLADTDTARRLRRTHVFRIVPMHNPDGVVAGNYRTNTSSINLENTWTYDRTEAFPVYLSPTAPFENRQLNAGTFAQALLERQQPVTLALNLHSSNSSPGTAAFFFPHFGTDPSRYDAGQRALFNRQVAFVRAVASHYSGRIEQPPADGGATFLNSFFPESWWWKHAGRDVNAITLETTYGRAGFGHWVTQNDWRDLGRALVDAIASTDRAGARLFAPTNDSVYRGAFKPEIYEHEEDK